MIRKNKYLIPMTFFCKQVMRRVNSFVLKISQFLVSRKVCVINARSMREFVESHLIKFNQPSSYLCFIIMDRWTQKRIQIRVKRILQKYLEAFSC